MAKLTLPRKQPVIRGKAVDELRFSILVGMAQQADAHVAGLIELTTGKNGYYVRAGGGLVTGLWLHGHRLCSKITHM